MSLGENFTISGAPAKASDTLADLLSIIGPSNILETYSSYARIKDLSILSGNLLDFPELNNGEREFLATGLKPNTWYHVSIFGDIKPDHVFGSDFSRIIFKTPAQ